MSMPESQLSTTLDYLRAMVAQGRYREAQACFDEYCRVLKETLRRLARGDSRRSRMEAEWRLLLEQTRRQVLTGRAHAAARLARLPNRRRAYGAAPRSPRTWELLG